MKPIVAKGLSGYANGMTLNDRSSLLAYLENRRSARPREMVAPGPTEEELQRILSIAARTPDHGKLAPWRLIVVGPDQRAAFADLLRNALPEHDPDASEAHFAKAEEFARQAPILVVVVSAPVQGHKIPVWEQELSAGAATMNLLHAANALGYAGGWVTGWYAYNPMVSAAFCNEGERIAGFVFIGTPGRDLEERQRPAIEQVASKWDPQSS